MSKTDGRVGKTTNVIIGGTVADDSAKDWLELDQKVFLSENLLLFWLVSSRVAPFFFIFFALQRVCAWGVYVDLNCIHYSLR